MSREFYYPSEWARCLDAQESNLATGVTPRWESGKNGQALRMALGFYKLRCFANRLQVNGGAIWERMSWKDALRIYLLNKHHWHLDHLRSIDRDEDFLFLLHDDLVAMKLNKEEADPVRQWTGHHGSRDEYEQHFQDVE
ncbi:hypothetical protein SAMN05216581_3307 [Pseudomonas asplenii]|uniref:Uncharacterized protein n=1 Tax=Pseudomonas asplenii TaxID=53407 RepID=A0A1H6NMT5_9PSED|nr:hypothetical protein SAMN05216581_3307 [Pseudomonas fuscovaginae]